MIAKISGTANFYCNQCGKRHTLEQRQLNFYLESRTEQVKGKETAYIAEYEEPCDQCGQEIYIKFEVWEYPSRVISYVDFSGEGASNIDSEFKFIYALRRTDVENKYVWLTTAIAIGAVSGSYFLQPQGTIIGAILGGLLATMVYRR